MSFFWYSNYMFSSGPSEEFSKLLADPETTTEQVLELDDTLTQAKRRCEPLLAFLTAPRLNELIRVLVDEPPADCSFTRGHKLPFAASEMLSSTAPEILDKVLAEPSVLQQLFAYLNIPVSNLTSAAYFCGAMLALLSHNPSVMYTSIFAEKQLLHALLKNLKSRSLSDLVFKIVFMDASVSNHFLLERFAILKELVHCLDAQHSPEEQVNASIVLCDLIRQMEAKSWKLLVCSLIQKDPLKELFLNIVDGPEKSSAASLSVLNALLACESLCELTTINLEKVIRVIQWSEDTNHEEDDQAEIESEDALIPLLLEYLPKVLARLSGDFETVGSMRLLICDFVETMLKQKSSFFDKMIIEAGGLRKITKMFFDYPLNSLLQKSYESIVHTITEKSSEEVQQHLLVDVGLPSSIAQAALTCKGRPGNSGLGNMGYVTRIANYLIGKQSELSWWQPSTEWTQFCGNFLAEVNEIEKQPTQKKESSDNEEENDDSNQDFVQAKPESDDTAKEEVRQEVVVSEEPEKHSPECSAHLFGATEVINLKEGEFMGWKDPVRKDIELEALD